MEVFIQNFPRPLRACRNERPQERGRPPSRTLRGKRALDKVEGSSTLREEPSVLRLEEVSGKP